MAEPHGPAGPAPSEPRGPRVDDAFEARWRAGRALRIEHDLNPAAADAADTVPQDRADRGRAGAVRNHTDATPADGTRRDRVRRLDALGDRFEADWAAGRTPRIEDYLAGVPEPDR